MHNLHIVCVRAYISPVFIVNLFYVFASTSPHPRIGSVDDRAFFECAV